MLLHPGDIAPEFTLKSSDKNDVSLHDFKGKNVVLFFFPLAFTRVCTAELCSVRDNIAGYAGLSAEVIAISVDSMYTLAKFKEDQGYNFLMLSDWNKDVSAAYGALYDEFAHRMKGVSRRASFVIDKEGKIRFIEILENAGELPNFVAINETLASLV